MDPRTGEILAMVSRPTFDPNDFAVRVSRDQWTSWSPILTTAAEQSDSGATRARLDLQIIMATAGLQEGIAQDMKVNCTGGATFLRAIFPVLDF